MARACCGCWAVDDDDEIARLLDGVELPNVADNAPDGGLGPRLTDMDELGDWE